MNEIELLRTIGTIKHFKKDELIFLQYESGEEMYVVLKGTFGVYINSITGFPVRVAGIKQGSFFGEMAIIDGSPRSATVISEEDDSVAVVIAGTDTFKLLLKQAPTMASKMLNTLHSRALVTAKAVLDAGKTVPKLPTLLNAMEYKDAVSTLSDLTLLAETVRQMNDLLVADSGKEKAAVEPDTQDQDTMKLLPDGYVKYNVTDLKDNRDTFRVMDVVCPYCHKSLKAYVPVYGHLGSKNESLDGRVIYSNLNILFYTNTICPNCNYADTYMEYSKPRNAVLKPKYTGNQFENVEKFAGYERTLNRTLDEAILSYYLNIDCLKRTSGDPLRFANAWIRLYWLYSDQGSQDFAKHAAKQARYYYKRYSDHNSTTMSIDDKLRINAILGEMSVVLGELDQAIEFFTENTVIGKGSKSDLLKESVNRCKELKKLA